MGSAYPGAIMVALIEECITRLQQRILFLTIFGFLLRALGHVSHWMHHLFAVS